MYTCLHWGTPTTSRMITGPQAVTTLLTTQHVIGENHSRPLQSSNAIERLTERIRAAYSTLDSYMVATGTRRRGLESVTKRAYLQIYPRLSNAGLQQKERERATKLIDDYISIQLELLVPVCDVNTFTNIASNVKAGPQRSSAIRHTIDTLQQHHLWYNRLHANLAAYIDKSVTGTSYHDSAIECYVADARNLRCITALLIFAKYYPEHPNHFRNINAP